MLKNIFKMYFWNDLVNNGFILIFLIGNLRKYIFSVGVKYIIFIFWDL